MQIFVSLPPGSEHTPFTLEVDPTDTISIVKEKITNFRTIAADQYDLYYNSEKLADDQQLADYNIMKEYTVNLVYRSTGDSGTPGTVANTGTHVMPSTDIGVGLLTLGVALVWLLRVLRRRPDTGRPTA